MKKTILLLATTWLISNISIAQYTETFDVPNKGIIAGPCTSSDPSSCTSSDFAGVNWTVEGSLAGFEFGGYFRTGGGVMEGNDVDEEICWLSPVLTMTGTASFTLDLSWIGFDDYDLGAVGSKDYIDVSYRIDGGAWVVLPNQVGGGPRTISYLGAGGNNDGSLANVGASGLTGSTLQIRVCADVNTSQEFVTIDNVSAVNATDGSAPLVCDLVLNSVIAVDEDCTDAEDGTITINATSSNGPINYSITGPVNASNSTGVFTGLPPGMYSIALQDGSFAPGTCTESSMATIGEADDMTPPTGTPPADVTVDCPADIPVSNPSLVTNLDDNCFIPCYDEPWINEFHYDNIGTDVNEFIEVAGPAGLDLSIYTIYVYDGFNGEFYNTFTLSGTVPNQQNGYGTVAFSTPNLQNMTEGIALVKNGTTVVEFLSYEGVLTATNGPAMGMTSMDVGVAESNDVTPSNGSLGRVGSSNRPTGFNFAVLTQTQGALNTGQSITTCPENTPTVAFFSDTDNGGTGTTVDPLIVTRTYRITDANGNTSDVTQTLTANNCCDAPSVNASVVSSPVCPGDDAEFQLTGTPSAEVTYNINGGTDQTLFLDASGAGALTISSPAMSQTLNLISALDTTENCQVALTGSFTVLVEDNTPPVASCQDLTVQLDNTGEVSITAANVDSGSSDNCGINNLALSQTDFTCSDAGFNTVTLTVTDESMNTSTCTATVTVEDNIAPVATCQDITVYLDGSGSSIIIPTDLDGGSTDNCSITNRVASATSFTCANVGPNSVTFTVADASSNTNSCISTVTVADTTAPVAICQDVTLQLDMMGDATLSTSAIINSVSDNCGILSLDLSKETFDCSDVGSNPVTLTVTDVNSNVSSCSANVTVEDNIPPTVICQDLTVQLDNTGEVSITPADVDNGSSDNCGSISLNLSQTDFTCSDVGVNTVTLTVTDQSNNSNICTATVTVEDNIAPVATCQDITVYLDGSGNSTITASDLDGGSLDNCSITNRIASSTSFTCSDVGPNNVTLTVTDTGMNTSACVSVVTVIDTIAPVANCQDVTVQLDMMGDASLLVSSIDNNSSDNCGILSIDLSEDAFTCTDVGPYPVTLTVTDVNSNISSCSANVTIEDNILPTAICQDLTVQLDNTGEVTITPEDIDNGSSDNCTTISLGLSQSNFTCSDVGANSVTLTVTDESNNTSFCTSTVTVEDNIPPTLSCQNATFDLDANGEFTLSEGDIRQDIFITESDNCGILGPIDISPNDAFFDCDDLGENEITLTTTDINGNSSSCTITLTLNDPTLACNQPPIAVCQPVNINANENCLAEVDAEAFDGGSSDPDMDMIFFAADPAGPYSLGTTNVTLIVTDENGASSTCTTTITVEDNTPPSLTCPTNITVDTDPGQCNAQVMYTAPEGTDNCSGVSTMRTGGLASGDNFPLGETTITYMATDLATNTATCSFIVNVEDNEMPNAVCLSQSIELNTEGIYELKEEDVFNTILSSDNCGITSVDFPTTVYSCDDLGMTYSVPVQVSDASGNISECSASITVAQGTELPDPWTNTSLGSGAGDASYDACTSGGELTISSNARSFPTSTDNYEFVSQELCGDILIEAQITEFAPNGFQGLYIRNTGGSSNAAGCSYLIQAVNTTTPLTLAQARIRQSNGSPTVQLFQFNTFTQPYWVRMTSSTLPWGGRRIKMYASSNGINWFLVQSRNVAGLGDCVDVGLVVQSKAFGQTATTKFSNVNVSGSMMGLSSDGSLTSLKAVNEKAFNIFPNPASNTLNVDLTSFTGYTGSIVMRNSLGQPVYSRHLEQISVNMERIDLIAYPSGMYFITLDIEGGEKYTKSVIIDGNR